MMPSEVVPSPQLIVAVKPSAVDLGSTSVNVATTPENAVPTVAAMFCAVTLRFGGAGATVATLLELARSLVTVSVMVTLTRNCA